MSSKLITPQVLFFATITLIVWLIFTAINASSVYEMFKDTGEIKYALMAASGIVVVYFIVLISPLFDKGILKTGIVSFLHVVSVILTMFFAASLFIGNNDILKKKELAQDSAKSQIALSEANLQKPITVDVSDELKQINKLKNKSAYNTRGDFSGTTWGASNGCDAKSDHYRLVDAVANTCRNISRLYAQIERLKQQERAGNVAETARQKADSRKVIEKAHDERMQLQPMTRAFYALDISKYLPFIIGLMLGLAMESVIILLNRHNYKLLNPPLSPESEKPANDRETHQTVADKDQDRQRTDVASFKLRACTFFAGASESQILRLIPTSQMPANANARKQLVQIYKFVFAKYEKNCQVLGVTALWKKIKSENTERFRFDEGNINWISKHKFEKYIYPSMIDLEIWVKDGNKTYWNEPSKIETIIDNKVSIRMAA